jgi:hypothetical protein
MSVETARITSGWLVIHQHSGGQGSRTLRVRRDRWRIFRRGLVEKPTAALRLANGLCMPERFNLSKVLGKENVTA